MTRKRTKCWVTLVTLVNRVTSDFRVLLEPSTQLGGFHFLTEGPLPEPRVLWAEAAYPPPPFLELQRYPLSKVKSGRCSPLASVLGHLQCLRLRATVSEPLCQPHTPALPPYLCQDKGQQVSPSSFGSSTPAEGLRPNARLSHSFLGVSSGFWSRKFFGKC